MSNRTSSKQEDPLEVLVGVLGFALRSFPAFWGWLVAAVVLARPWTDSPSWGLVAWLLLPLAFVGVVAAWWYPARRVLPWGDLLACDQYPKLDAGLTRRQRRWALRTARSWFRACQDVGIEFRGHRKDARTLYPKLIRVSPSALGIELLVRPARGQKVEAILSEASGLESYWDREVRAERDKSGRPLVTVTVVERDPLGGIRQSVLVQREVGRP